MIQVQDKSSEETITQIFNFLDQCGASNFNLEALSNFLKARGILQPSGKLEGKEAESYYLTNMSSFLSKDNLDEDMVDERNDALNKLDSVKGSEVNLPGYNDSGQRDEKWWYFEGKKNPYKLVMLDAFRQIADPFGVEIKGTTGAGVTQEDNAFDFEPNPAQPTQP